MTTDIYIYDLGRAAGSLTSYGVLGLAQGVIPVLRGKGFSASGVRAGNEGKYFFVDNGPRKRVVVFAGRAMEPGMVERGTDVEMDSVLVARGRLRPLRVSVAMKTAEEEAEAVAALWGVLSTFGGEGFDGELRKDIDGEFVSISDLVGEYGTMGLDGFDMGGVFD